MSSYALPLFVATATAFAFGTASAGDVAGTDVLSSYLVDVSPGPVTAGQMVGLDANAISDVTTTKDLVVSIGTLSGKGAGSGRGIAVTPARTAILPMSGRLYVQDPGTVVGGLRRLLGNATVSYAENDADIAGTGYRKSAVSLSSTVYLEPKTSDPIFLGYRAFTSCTARQAADADAAKDVAALAAATTDAERKAAQDALNRDHDRSVKADAACAADKRWATPWNSTQLAMSAGEGWIQPATGGTKLSLGTRFTLTGIVDTGSDTALYLALQRVIREIDTNTLSTTPAYKNSTLVAARFTLGSAGDANSRMLVEASSARAAQNTASSGVYMAALGYDRRMTSGLWLQLRVGRKRSDDSGRAETSGTFGVNWAPAAGLFAK